MAEIALSNKDPEWEAAARSELLIALQTDFSSADLLAKLITVDLDLKNDTEAQHYYDQFKRVAKASPLIQLVAHSHQQGRPAVTAPP